MASTGWLPASPLTARPLDATSLRAKLSRYQRRLPSPDPSRTRLGSAISSQLARNLHGAWRERPCSRGVRRVRTGRGERRDAPRGSFRCGFPLRGTLRGAPRTSATATVWMSDRRLHAFALPPDLFLQQHGTKLSETFRSVAQQPTDSLEGVRCGSARTPPGCVPRGPATETGPLAGRGGLPREPPVAKRAGLAERTSNARRRRGCARDSRGDEPPCAASASPPQAPPAPGVCRRIRPCKVARRSTLVPRGSSAPGSHGHGRWGRRGPIGHDWVNSRRNDLNGQGRRLRPRWVIEAA